ncbi:MAG: matrixin family metalloprotease [bacterium]|nr:matrixin family metalloprotease [bacterium]
MKKIILSTFIATIAITACMNFNNNFTVEENTIQFKNISAMALGYDRSMSEKTIKATVIDSYFRQVCKNGKIIRWNKSTFPLKVYIEDSKDLPDYYREIVMNAYTSWQRASEGLVRFEFVESPSEADMKCYFKNTDNKNSIGVHAFAVSGNKITDSVIVFNKTDNKGHSHDSKQLYSSALQEIGHSLGLTGASQSIYDVMYPIGTKFNTEITPRDLKTLGLLYAVVPDITNEPLTNEEKSQLFTVSEILNTLNVPVTNDTKNLDEIISNDISTHLALAEQYRRRAQYDKACKEYQAVAQMKNDARSRSEVYYEIAVMYTDAEEFDNAKSYAEIAWATDENDLTITLPPLINYYTKRSNTATEQLEDILRNDPYNKHAYKLLCKIYRDKHHENLLNSTIKKYGKTAGNIE